MQKEKSVGHWYIGCNTETQENAVCFAQQWKITSFLGDGLPLFLFLFCQYYHNWP